MADESRKVTIANTLGLHMRPVMRFVDLASQFRASVVVKREDHAVDGKNAMEMMMLEATRGVQVEIEADGPDAAEAVKALVELVENGFGEE